MNKSMMLPVCAAFLLLFASCTETPKQETTATSSESAKPDAAQVRTDIIALENEWAKAINAKDIKTLMAMYADDAVSMPDGAPILSGKAAIQKQQEEDFAKPPKFASIAFETMDVYPQGDVVTEVGKAMYKDASGKTIGGGKYMAVFEKRDGKYVCIREIYNSDSKDK